MAEEEERPFKAEYAKSGRAGCKLCKGTINKDTLRIAKMVQVTSFQYKPSPQPTQPPKRIIGGGPVRNYIVAAAGRGFD